MRVHRVYDGPAGCPVGHDGDADGALVRVLKATDQVSLTGLLQGHDGRALEAQVRPEVLGDLADEKLEGQLADERATVPGR